MPRLQVSGAEIKLLAGPGSYLEPLGWGVGVGWNFLAHKLVFLSCLFCYILVTVLPNSFQCFLLSQGAELRVVHYLALEGYRWPLPALEKGTPLGYRQA